MDNNNWRPSLPNGEPAMDTSDWRTQLSPDSRNKIVNKIMETLKKHLSFSPPEGELRIIAARFEDKIFSCAVNRTDYLRKISTKMLILEGKAQNTAGSLTSLPPANNTTPLESVVHLMDNNNGRPSLPKEEPDIDTIDWRTQFPPNALPKIVNRIMETLRKHLPIGAEGINELRRVSARFEEKIFSGVVNQTDYLRKISMKIFTMQTTSQAQAGYLTSLPAANKTTPLYQSGYHMDNDNSRTCLPKSEPDLNIDDWRTHLPPDSRQENVNKIMEALNKHVPISGQEGVNELMRIAASYEELIFNNARNEADYFRKRSFKIQTTEEGTN